MYAVLCLLREHGAQILHFLTNSPVLIHVSPQSRCGTTNEASGVYLSVVAGLSAALSSVFGKIAFDSSIIPHWLNLLAPWILNGSTGHHPEYLLFVLRGVCFVMIFLTNVIMINLFVKSMNLSTTSEAVVVNTACNFFFTVR